MSAHRRTRGVLAIGIAATALALSACVPLFPGAGMGDPALPADVNRADVMFVEMMIPHHEQAIEMSDLLLAKEGVDAEVIDLANAIRAAQGPEIDLMESWLDAWGLPSMSGREGMDGMDHRGMDGMMSDDDMDALAAAEGTEAERLFLEQMIEHHEGAIEMVEDLLDDGENADVRALGDRIIVTQQAEIELMRELLG